MSDVIKTNSQCRTGLVESTSCDLQLHGDALGSRMEHPIGKSYMKRTFQFQIEGFKVRTVHAEAESETVTITKGGVLRSFGLVNPLEYEEVCKVLLDFLARR